MTNKNNHHNSDHDFEEGIELDVINLVFEDPDDPEGEVEVECGVIGIFESGVKEYIALVVPDGDDGNLEEVIYIYEYSEDEEGYPTLGNIESEEEYDSVVDTFNEIYQI